MFIEGERRGGERRDIDENWVEALNVSTNKFFQTLEETRSLVDPKYDSLNFGLLMNFFSQLEYLKREWGRAQTTVKDFSEYRDIFMKVVYPELPPETKQELSELRKEQSSRPLSETERRRLLILQALEELVEKLEIPYPMAVLLVEAREQLVNEYDRINKEQANRSLEPEEVRRRDLLGPYVKVLRELVRNLEALERPLT